MIINVEEIKNYEHLSKRMDEIFQDAQKDLDLNEMNIREKALAAPALKAKWGAIRFAEESFLRKLERKRENMMEQYTEEFGVIGKPKFQVKNEMLKSVEIQKIDKIIKSQKELVSFVLEILKTFYGLGFDIKNSIEILKLES